MASNWYARQGDKTFGPLDDQQLRQLVSQGTITRQASVSRGNDGPWVSAEKIKGLFIDSQEPPNQTSTTQSTPLAPKHTAASSTSVRSQSISLSAGNDRGTAVEVAPLKPNTGSGWVLLTIFMFAPAFSSCYYALGGKATLKEHYVVTTREHVREGNRVKLDEVEERNRYFSVDKSENLRPRERLLWCIAAVVLMPLWILSTFKSYRAVRLHIAAAKQSGSRPPKN